MQLLEKACVLRFVSFKIVYVIIALHMESGNIFKILNDGSSLAPQQFLLIVQSITFYLRFSESTQGLVNSYSQVLRGIKKKKKALHILLEISLSSGRQVTFA